MSHRWPGNVRELRNAVERAYILCDGELDLSEQDMPTLRGAAAGRGRVHGDEIHMPIGATLDEIERTFILATLKHFEGDKRRAADVLGCSLKTLYNKLHAYDRERTRDPERSTGSELMGEVNGGKEHSRWDSFFG